MKLYYGGAEVPSHRTWLQEAGIDHAYLSYVGLRRRIKFARPWLIKDKFPGGMHVLLDSGAHTYNKQEEAPDLAQLAEVAGAYEAFVAANAERVDAFTEFDALPLGLGWIQARREDYYLDFGDKFMPVWHPEWGIDDLEALAASYRRVAIVQTALGDRDLIPVLNMLAGRRGTLFHGIAMTKPSVMRAVRWESVGSTSWLSPIKFGDTFVWTGQELKRYPKAYKDQARKRHRTLFTMAGFDSAKIAADDPNEVIRLSLWSWQRLMDDVNSTRKRDEVSERLRQPDPVLADRGNLPAADLGGDSADRLAGPQVEHRDKILLPGISLFRSGGEDGTHLGIRGDNLRRCDTCFLRERNCPGYKPGADCLYEMPIEIKTAADVKAVESALLAMQTQRVMFMRMAEDLEGGYADPNLSGEIDRLTRMIKAQREGAADKFSLRIEASNRPGEVSMLGQIFGKEAAGKMAQIEPPSVVDDMIKESMMGEVFEGEVIE